MSNLKQHTAIEDELLITVSGQTGTNNTFDVTSVGFDTEKQYTVAEFNQALKKANYKWQENWDGLSYPSNIVIVTVENLHNEPCSYRINLTDADYNSIQDIVELSPTPMHASIPTDKAIEKLNKAENIWQMQDISHKANNAALSAARMTFGHSNANGQKGSNTMGKTKMECTSMKINPDSSSKVVATASVVINDEFVLTQMKLVNGKNGLFLSMPQRKFGDEYQDVIIPKSKEAYDQLLNTVKEAYSGLQKSGLDEMKLDKKEPPENSVSKIKVSLFEPSKESDTVKAVGRVEIDDSIIVSGVTVKHGANKEGVEKDFVSMPSYKFQNEVGQDTYVEYAHAITADFRGRIENSVFNEYQMLQNTEHRGVKFSELGEKSEIAFKNSMNNQFAAKLMDELDKNNITYSAKITGKTTLSIKNADKAAVDKIEKSLSDKLTKDAQKTEQQPEQQKTAPKKSKAH